MQEAWLKRNDENTDLVIFMLGWAATPNAVLHIDPPGCDVLACYDYRRIAPLEAQRFARYRRIYLVAWSFGVWGSEECCADLPLYKAIAFNGTPFPVDERYGMRLRVVMRTMRTLARKGGDNPFADNATGSMRYMPPGPFAELSAEEKIEELSMLAERSAAHSESRLSWDVAYMADKDEIFPPQHMRDYWSSRGLGTEFDSYHYPFADPHIVLRHIDAL